MKCIFRTFYLAFDSTQQYPLYFISKLNNFTCSGLFLFHGWYYDIALFNKINMDKVGLSSVNMYRQYFILSQLNCEYMHNL